MDVELTGSAENSGRRRFRPPVWHGRKIGEERQINERGQIAGLQKRRAACRKALAQGEAIGLALPALVIHAITAVAAVVGHRGDRRTAVRRIGRLKRKQCDQKRREIQKETLCHLGDHSGEFTLINDIVAPRSRNAHAG